MREIRLLFNESYVPLGEIVFESGAFRSASLSREGEERLGPEITEWQIRGIPVLRDEVRLSGAERNIVTKTVRVKRTDPAFADACTEWILAHGMLVVTFGEDRIAAWEKLLVLPLPPKERYAYACLATRLPLDSFTSWTSKLDAAAERVERDVEQATQIPRLAVI